MDNVRDKRRVDKYNDDIDYDGKQGIRSNTQSQRQDHNIDKRGINSPSLNTANNKARREYNYPNNKLIEYNKPIQIQQYKSVIPVPLPNPRNYGFVNCVIQVLRSCLEFTYEIIKYHKSGDIANAISADKERFFVNDFCKLIYEMMNKAEPNKKNHYDTLNAVQQYLHNSEDGDDVQRCFMIVLSAIHNVTKKNSPIVDFIAVNKENKEDSAFQKYRNKNEGFVFDLFFGQMCHLMVCKQCKYVNSESFHLFKTFPVPVIDNGRKATLLDCIECILAPSDMVLDEKMDCKCLGGSMEFYSQSHITHSPTYIFIYLTRGSYYPNGLKNNSTITFAETLLLPTLKGKVEYQLISVIDHVGDNEGGHYYCRSNCEGDNWWHISDWSVNNIGTDFKNIKLEQAIAFIFKKSSKSLGSA